MYLADLATTRRSTGRIALAVTAAAVLLLGCGGDDDASTAPSATAAGEVGEVGEVGDDGPADAAEPAIIVISGFAFNGPESVPVGTTVEVRNNDSAPHSWTSVDGVFDSGTLAMSESFEFTFDEAGEYSFFCAIHPSMTGTITVTD